MAAIDKRNPVAVPDRIATEVVPTSVGDVHVRGLMRSQWLDAEAIIRRHPDASLSDIRPAMELAACHGCVTPDGHPFFIDEADFDEWSQKHWQMEDVLRVGLRVMELSSGENLAKKLRAEREIRRASNSG